MKKVEVIVKATEIATILDESYGNTRGVYDLGGFIQIVEDRKDVETVKKLIDFEHTLPEYVDLISCSNGELKMNY